MLYSRCFYQLLHLLSFSKTPAKSKVQKSIDNFIDDLVEGEETF